MHRLPSLLFALAASAAVGGMAANAPAGVRLARYAGDKAAAASFTFDDGYKSHTAIAEALDACVETAADAIRVTLRPGPEEVVVTWAGGDRP